MMGSVLAANWSAFSRFLAAPSLPASAIFGPPLGEGRKLDATT
jgi:hypothetical protein